MNEKALYDITYGLYLISAKDGARDNACISNTAVQVTSSPKRITLTLNKGNFTTELINNSGAFNVSVISKNAPFSLFKNFGFQSGRNVNKFDGIEYVERAPNGILRLSKYGVSFICAKVIDSVDLGTHTMFVADVCDCDSVRKEEPVSYGYYQSFIKPKPAPQKKSGFRCKVCGYFYEGDTLPADFTCPVCKHPASDFERVEAQDAPKENTNLVGSKTEANLKAAFAGESQARNKYTVFAARARSDGYENIAKIFEETAANEFAHASLWFNLFNGNNPTSANLKSAASGENYEWTSMYADFAKVAKAEGFSDIAALFEQVGKIENRHEKRYLDLLEKVADEKVFKSDAPATWECLNCGYRADGNEAPDKCPVCGFSKSHFAPVAKS